MFGLLTLHTGLFGQFWKSAYLHAVSPLVGAPLPLCPLSPFTAPPLCFQLPTENFPVFSPLPQRGLPFGVA